MTGPYAAHVFLTGRPHSQAAPDFTLTWEDSREELAEGDRIARRYYRTGGGATMLGTVRAAAFAVGGMLAPGEEAVIRLWGREGGEPAERPGAYVRRDAAGRLFTDLGSRWGRERHFIGA